MSAARRDGTWWSNCVIYALRRWRLEGGYIIVRRSRHEKRGLRWRGWWPHVLWSRTLRGPFYEFVPTPDMPRALWFPPPVFRGSVRVTYDEE